MRGRKDIRLKQYDYKKDGFYFVTPVSAQRKKVFFGKELSIEKELLDTVNKCQGVKLDYYVIMPDHVHIIFILRNCNLHLGEIVRRFKAKVSYRLGESVWQWNYYEHVIRNETALNKIREYIINNPQELLLKFDQFYQ